MGILPHGAQHGGARHLDQPTLDAQVASYVEEALTVDRASAYELLNRKAPVSQRLEYWFIRLMYGAHLMGTRLGQAFKTILPVHVSPGKDCHA